MQFLSFMVGGSWCFCSKTEPDCITIFHLMWRQFNGVAVIIPSKASNYITVQMQTRLPSYTWRWPNLDSWKGKCFSVFNNGKIGDNERWKKLGFFATSHRVSWEFPLCARLCSGDVAWMGSQHWGFKRKQQPELLSVWKPRLRCSVSSAIVLVIVNLGHLPGGISHSSNKFHKTNHKVLHCWLPLIEFWAHKHISKCLTARYGLSDD